MLPWCFSLATFPSLIFQLTEHRELSGATGKRYSQLYVYDSCSFSMLLQFTLRSAFLEYYSNKKKPTMLSIMIGTTVTEKLNVTKYENE